MRCFSWPMVACHGEGEVEWKCVEVGEVEKMEVWRSFWKSVEVWRNLVEKKGNLGWK